MGIGAYQVREYVRSLGGDVDVQSTPGMGTQFCIRLELCAKTSQRLLIVEDDLGLQKQLKWCFDSYEVILAASRSEAIAQMRRFEPAVVLQDLGLPPDAEGVSEGMATVKELLQLAPHTKVIVVTGNADRESAVRAVGLGAWDFYSKPVDTDVLKLIVQRAFHIAGLEAENMRLRATHSSSPLEGIIATDASMQGVCRMLEKVAPSDVSVLLLGESGTGKELVARAIHARSDRKSKRFVAINCAAIPEQLLESELFGFEKGAFTGAVRQTLGKIEYADGGTLFLDEIGDMPLSLQAKLLRFLQDRVIERVGGRQEIPVDVRVVCATNQDLAALITTQRFRQDLYYRISEVNVNLPPLRVRPGDVVVLAQAFLRRFTANQARAPRGFIGGSAGRAAASLLARQRARAREQGEGGLHHGRRADDHTGGSRASAATPASSPS